MDNMEQELLRKALLRYLAQHHPAAFTVISLATSIPARGLVDFEPKADDIHSALHVLRDLNMVRSVNSPVGASVYWSASAAGKLAYERGEV